MEANSVQIGFSEKSPPHAQQNLPYKEGRKVLIFLGRNLAFYVGSL